MTERGIPVHVEITPRGRRIIDAQVAQGVAMTDYGTSKYQDELTERAYAVTLDGMQEDSSGDLSCGVDWSALVVVDGRHVIIRQDEQGFVWTDYSENMHNPTDRAGRCAVVRAWDRIVEEDAVRLEGSDY